MEAGPRRWAGLGVGLALGVVGCAKKDIGGACRELEAKGFVRACERATIAPVARQHHVAEQWDFREPGDGKGFGSLTLYDSPVAFESEARDMADISRELHGFHYENETRLVQLETRYAVAGGVQSKMIEMLDSL